MEFCLLIMCSQLDVGKPVRAGTTLTVDITVSSPQATVDLNNPNTGEPFVATAHAHRQKRAAVPL